MTHPLTEPYLQSISTPKSFERGYALYRSGAVFDTFQRGSTLIGCCQGNSFPFYQERIVLDDQGVRKASCNCINEGSGYCKHVIAVLLTYLHQPDVFVEQVDLLEALNQMDREALVRLLMKAADQSLELNSWLQSAVQSELRD